FLSHTNGYKLFLTANEAVMVMAKIKSKDDQRKLVKNSIEAFRFHHEDLNAIDIQTAVLRMQLMGANADPQIDGVNQLPNKSNYFIGNDAAKWHTDIPNYAGLRYKNVYPDIDLLYYGNQRQMEYDFIISPGADPNLIKLNFEGAEKIALDGQGNLILSTKLGK